MASMWWRSRSEDERAAGGWHGEDFGGNHVREVMVINLVRQFSIWKRPALIVRHYDDGRVTLSEGEWKP